MSTTGINGGKYKKLYWTTGKQMGDIFITGVR
jgi:hypothetical protein